MKKEADKTNKKIKVLLFGPELNAKNAFYGGGVGGYTRSMSIFLKYFTSNKFILIPCFYSVRKKGKFPALMFPVRFMRDILIFSKGLISVKPGIIHILGQYRKSVPREFFIVFISKLFNADVVYQIIAGSFIRSFNEGSRISKAMVRYILKNSKAVLAEGEIYISFLKQITKKENCFYFPNFIPFEEIPQAPPKKFQKGYLQVLFAGFLYEGKGVFELVEGLNVAAKKGIKINLTLVGEESSEFSSFMSSFVKNENLNISRKGLQPHEIVLKEMQLNDVYLYPTKHLGEGHTNSINEAMMNNMVIISTQAGFLSSVLENCAYFLEKGTAEEIAETICFIVHNKEHALEKAAAARNKLLNTYTSKVQIANLDSFYQFATSKAN
jgi:glycosyltransferase involved in cell wall biosynthesis